jgi:hypothetical protein
MVSKVPYSMGIPKGSEVSCSIGILIHSQVLLYEISIGSQELPRFGIVTFCETHT